MESILFEPMNIGPLTVNNRFVRSATAENMATPEGHPTPVFRDMYFELAEGEVGLIITGGTAIEPMNRDSRTSGPSFPSIGDDRDIPVWGSLVAGIHDRGARIAMQLGHPGRLLSPEMFGQVPIAPSPVPVEQWGTVPREMTIGDIEQVGESFAQACRRVKEAGFDGVQLLGCHGNLISNFISPFTNLRDDAYGGSTENRSRFIVEIVRRARVLVGPEFPIMIKMNFDDFIPGGLDKEEALRVAEIIVNAGIDCIEVSGGTLSETPERIAPENIDSEAEEACFKDYSRALKERVTIPVMLVGGLRSFSLMGDLVKEGVADMVSMCRPLIREPGLVARWKSGDTVKSTCISCNQCWDNWFLRPLRCYVDEPLKEDE